MAAIFCLRSSVNTLSGLGLVLASGLGLVLAFGSAFLVLLGYIFRSFPDSPVPVAVPATCIVTINGKPAPGWSVKFIYAGFDGVGKDAAGTANEEGRVTLATTSPPTLGVLPGEYAVALVPPPLPENAFVECWGPGGTIMDYYQDPERSRYNATVTSAGVNEFAYDITCPGVLFISTLEFEESSK